MKRDLDLIRDLLLQIEEKYDGNFGMLEINYHGEVGSPEFQKTVEHIYLMGEAGLIEVRDHSHMSGREYSPKRMTWWGHDFLDSIRDPEVWDQTKKLANKAGAGSLDLVGDIAKGFIKTKIKQHTGIDV